MMQSTVRHCVNVERDNTLISAGMNPGVKKQKDLTIFWEFNENKVYILFTIFKIYVQIYYIY